jgi:hypothetical protein
VAANTGEICHRTEWYFVRVADGDQYEVVNRNTGVVEATEKLLPQAILHAENSNSFMVNRLWRWVAAQGKQQGEAMEGTVDPLEALLETGTVEPSSIN